MLLSELTTRWAPHGQVRAWADADYQGFRGFAHIDPTAEGAAALAAGDLLLVDAGMHTLDPWELLGQVPEGVTIAVAVPGEARALPIGRVVLAMTTAQVNVVAVDELEQVYRRHVVVVGSRGELDIDERRARRLMWEQACGELLERASARTTDELRQQLAQARHETDAVRAALTTAIEDAGFARAETQSVKDRYADVAKQLREARNSREMRLGSAVVAAKRNPGASMRAVGSEIMEVRRARKLRRSSTEEQR